jgi:hypothetical protein
MEAEIESFQMMPETNPEYFNMGTLRMKRKGRNQYTLTGDLEFLLNTGNDFQASACILLKSGSNANSFNFQMSVDVTTADGRSVYKVSKPFCDFLRDIIYPAVKDCSNIPNVCPLPKVCTGLNFRLIKHKWKITTFKSIFILIGCEKSTKVLKTTFAIRLQNISLEHGIA